MTELHHAQTIRSDLQQHPRCLHVKHLKERGKKTTNGSQFCLKTTRLPFPIGLFKKGAIISRLTFFTTFIFMLSVTCTSLLMQFILHSSTFKGNNYLYVCKSLTNARHLRPMPILIFECFRDALNSKYSCIKFTVNTDTNTKISCMSD